MGISVIEDAAEALGATYSGRSPGTLGKAGVFSFNGNKIITTSGGGMLVSDDADFIAHARKLATQAREPAPHYEHAEIGYNYRLSNVLRPKEVPQRSEVERPSAGGSCASWKTGTRHKREIFAYNADSIGDLPGITLMPEAPWGRATHWLTGITVDPQGSGGRH